ncbi:hypothetical protein [Nocardioides mangrovi]|uniref:Secreted protein n=1 Tax=Nocardioides mangrovi TaxID=2874580 RepID=A0ABS7UJV6_9ACTN|nr:hypothetical protein [Nocardioides mangrovi]MBZ5741271.1 hypothetical protein [Nocardioides mangrovi]
MIRKKSLVAAAGIALVPLAAMAPANAYYTIGDCDSASAGVTLTVVTGSPGQWNAYGHVNDGQGRNWKWKIYSKVASQSGNGTLEGSGSRTGTGDMPAGAIYWVKRAQPEHVKLVVDNAAGTIHCTAAVDVTS